MAHHVSKRRFALLVQKALEELPEPFAAHLEEITIEVKDRARLKDLKDAGLGRDDLLLGLYHGQPITERTIDGQSGALPDVIYIFQEDVELASDSEDDLVEQVRTTVLHEIGHHFGLDEEDLDRRGYG